MSGDQLVILGILLAAGLLFLWGRWRHDLVALAALLACVGTGLVPAEQAFAGFGHPAVITVACVLVLSSALQSTGAVDGLARMMLPRQTGPTISIAMLSGLAAVLSGFMNNVGALALLMPLAADAAARLKVPPGRVLMPVAFSSILGGMTTLIGTPPNLIVSGFRAEHGAGSFSMFDFTPAGLAVAFAGLVFIVIFGRWLVPVRAREGAEGFEIGAYMTEARVSEDAKAAGMTLRDIEAELVEIEAQVLGLIRNERRILVPNPFREVHAGDILVIEGDPDALTKALSGLGLQLEAHVQAKASEETSAEKSDHESRAADTPSREKARLESDDIVLAELAVRWRAEIVDRSAADIALRKRFGINLLAISREGQRSTERLRSSRIREGDVLLVQGPPEAIRDFANQFGCVPLAKRLIRIPQPQKAIVATGVMAAAVAGASFGLVPAAAAFAAGVLAIALLRVIPVRRLYDAIDWPVIVLLGALIPVAGAMSTTGTADLIATSVLGTIAGDNAIVALVVILVVTMMLSDFMNNVATAAVMCPIAIGVAGQLGVNADAFLMAVAIGASCAFLTPIGHQNNTLILGPGGFRFGDYWRLGLPLEVVIVAVAVPMVLWVWPL